MMETYRIYAKDLEEDEVDYELSIRGYPLEGPMDTRYRSLRLALRQPENGDALLNTEYSLTGDFVVVPIKHKRVRRYVPETDAQRRNQQELLDVINRMMLKYYNVDLRDAADLVPVMRLAANRPEAAGAAARGMNMRDVTASLAKQFNTGSNAIGDGVGVSTPVKTRISNGSLPPVGEELISFTEDGGTLSCPQGTPKAAVASTGAVRKQPMEGEDRGEDGLKNVAGEVREPMIPAKRRESGEVPPGIASPKGAVGGVPVSRFEPRNPLRPIEVDCLWETPEFKSSIPNTLIPPKQRVSSEPLAAARQMVSPGVVRGKPLKPVVDEIL